MQKRFLGYLTLFSLVFLLSFPCLIFAEDKSQQQEGATVSAQEKADQQPASSVETAEGKQPEAASATGEKSVTAIEIKGNKAISTNVIISKLKTRVGTPYQENITSDDLKRLYLLGYFSDIKIDTQDYKDGVKIIITVTERPIIEKITFAGIKRLAKDEKLKQSLKSKEGQYLDYPSISEDVRTIKKMYEKIGYVQAGVDYTVDINQVTNKAKIQFNVIEGKRIRIKDIYVEGNKAFSDARILKLIKTKHAWLFNAGVFKEEVFKEDIERVKAFYRHNGYADVIVDYDITTETDVKKPFMYIKLTIQEGKKYLVGNVVVQGNVKISEKAILASIKQCVPGKVFSQDAMRQDVTAIQGLYFDKGYISAQVESTTSYNKDSGRIDILYSITENDIYYVNKILIRGNIKTRDVVVRRELRLKPGDRFDGEKLRRSKERLQNLGFFEDVSYDTEETDIPDKKDLVVEVKETKTGSFSFGGGYSTVDEFVGFVEVEQNNFDWKNWPYFTGGGQNLKFRASAGSLSNNFNLSFTNPWVFDYPLSFGFDVYRTTHDRDTDVGYGYSEKVTGGDLRLGKEISEYINNDLTYKLDNIDIRDVEDPNSELNQETGENVVSSLTYGMTFDNRDNVFDTHKGNLLRGEMQVAGGPFGGDKDYYKFFSRASHYFPLFLNSVLEARARVGLADKYGNSDRIPIYERFFAGGASTIRGYRERKIGPIDSASNPLGGNSMFIGNLEYTYPLFSFLKVAVFADTGNVWEKIGDFAKGGLKSSVGLGFRIKTPIGPIMLDYGIPFNKEPGDEDKGDGRFHFSVGQSF